MLPSTRLRRYLLDTTLLGREAAPLRKAIIDSGIGSDMVSSGALPLGREIAFAVGVKDSEADRRVPSPVVVSAQIPIPHG